MGLGGFRESLPDNFEVSVAAVNDDSLFPRTCRSGEGLSVCLKSQVAQELASGCVAERIAATDAGIEVCKGDCLLGDGAFAGIMEHLEIERPVGQRQSFGKTGAYLHEHGVFDGDSIADLAVDCLPALMGDNGAAFAGAVHVTVEGVLVAGELLLKDHALG